MICTVCRSVETRPGLTTMTLERGSTTLVVKEVPASVCPNCGEVYLNGKTTETLLKLTEDAFSAGVQVEVRKFAA